MDHFVGTYTMHIVCYLAEVLYHTLPNLRYVPALASLAALMFADADLPYPPEGKSTLPSFRATLIIFFCSEYRFLVVTLTPIPGAIII
ncbi:hypothetical protein INP83_16355 [Mucilaginibacter sp. 21P]|uniref:hypothetical protein n=1 Tax=Mucilaginibacter sp. 21P TaxID=2778902 RepID=UPI001C57823B|nr:hypothetical protein [Mucilaginibacter sp. 21P]QXV64645.1 hypothetical protein INP83_16355 [Mucilaginibacter sp. 21P]